MKRIVYLDGQQEDPRVEHITFPTGEKHIRIKELRGVHAGICGGQGLEDIDAPAPNEVVLVYNDPAGDVMKLGMAVNICRQAEVPKITVIMPFVPYARQDEVYVEGDPLSIEVFAKFLNSLAVDKVIITDPHSKVTPALIDNVQIVHQHELAAIAVMELDENLMHPIALVAPDLGATKKIKALQSYIKQNHGLTLPIIQCDKTRDPETGKITGFKILDGSPYGHHCLIVDDIADGANTFVGLGKVIKNVGCEGQSLYVTHGIFSKGTDHLSKLFDHIYATDSFPKKPGVRVIELNKEHAI